MTTSISLIGRVATRAEFFIGSATICQAETVSVSALCGADDRI